MKKVLILSVALCVMAGCQMESEAATITRGETFTSTDTVTNTRLHELVDDATIADIEQTDIKSNYGLAVKSSTQPSDTDSLWIDTTNNCAKAYVSGAYEEIGTTPTTLSTTTGAFSGAVTASSTLAVSDTGTFSADVTIAKDCTIDGNLSVASTKKILHESIVKAWVNFAGSSTINDSFNMTSITDNGTGDFTLTFDEDFANANYVIAGIAIATGGGDASTTISLKVGTTLSVGACTIVTESDNGGTNVDCNPTMIMAIGR